MHFRSVCDSLGEFAEVVGKSSSSSVPKLYNSGQGWQWYNWKGRLPLHIPPESKLAPESTHTSDSAKTSLVSSLFARDSEMRKPPDAC